MTHPPTGLSDWCFSNVSFVPILVSCSGMQSIKFCWDSCCCGDTITQINQTGLDGLQQSRPKAFARSPKRAIARCCSGPACRPEITQPSTPSRFELRPPPPADGEPTTGWWISGSGAPALISLGQTPWRRCCSAGCWWSTLRCHRHRACI